MGLCGYLATTERSLAGCHRLKQVWGHPTEGREEELPGWHLYSPLLVTHGHAGVLWRATQ